MNLRNGFLGIVMALLMVMVLSLTPALADPPAGSKVSHPRGDAEHEHKDKEKGKERFRQEKLPLGPASLRETRTSDEIAPGVIHTRIARGEQSSRDRYVVDVAFKATHSEAREVARRLAADGYLPRTERISERAPNDPARGPLGYLVRVGSFKTEAEANTMRARLTADGYQGLRVVYTGEDGGKTTGPWVVNVLQVDPERFRGKLGPQLATEIVPGKEKLTSMATRTNALAGINGGYFVVGPTDGTPGDLAGISAINGALISEAVNGRTSLILPSTSGKGARVTALSTRQEAIASGGARREVDGLNRKPGLIRGCGGTGGDVPTERPKHDYTCTDSSELIQFTPAFGPATEPGEGAEAVLDQSGMVIEFRDRRGGGIPHDGSVLSGVGDGAEWLRANARPGAQVQVKDQIMAEGSPLRLTEPLGIVNGGPRLLRNGNPDITAYAEGFHWPENPEFYYRFGERRNPRTLAGVTGDGKLLLVTVDGRQPGWSVGASFQESAGIMRALGASDAVNLDGGGSTTMTVGQQLMTRPSDQSGERPIADAVLLQR